MEDEINSFEEELFEHFNYKADPGQGALRLDKFLAVLMPNASRSKIQDLAKDGKVFVNGIAQKSNYKVKAHDEVSVKRPYPVREIKLEPENIPLEILYEDDSIIIINKQAGLVVHPGHGNYTGTLVNALLYHFDTLAEKKDEPDRPGLVHRLDKDTSGVMVIAKTQDALRNLSKQFYDRTNDRRYYALVWGDFNDDEGEIEGNIGRSYKDRKVMDVFPEGDYGKHALTRYKVLERFNYITLVECKLETGRTHQIRAHFKLDKNPFKPHQLKHTTSADESKELNFFIGPCVIISASGMCEAGRIRHHLKRDGNLYTTHGLGPVAQYLNIDRGDRFEYLTSMSSPPSSLIEHSKTVNSDNEFYDRDDFKHGDMNTSLI